MENVLYLKTKVFAGDVVRFVQALKYSAVNSVMGKQLLRCGTSVYANYRAVCRARSKADFIAKLGIVEEEADESLCWLELMTDTDVVDKKDTEKLIKSAGEILSMVVASLKTAKRDRDKR